MHAAASSSQNNANSNKNSKSKKNSQLRNTSKQLVDLEQNKLKENMCRKGSRNRKVNEPKSKKSTEKSKSKEENKKRAINTSKELPDLEELVEEEKEQKNWKGIGIALLVIVVVFSCVAVAVVLVTPEEVVAREGEKLSLEEYLNGDYEPYSIKPIWSRAGTQFMYKTQENNLIVYECENNYSTIFLDSSPFNEFSTNEFLVSNDKSFVLFPYHRKTIFTHTSLIRYKLYDTDTRLSRDLIGPNGNEFLFVKWTTTGQGLVVVQDNNIYYKSSFTDRKSEFIQITTNGKEETIYNGVTDWLYGEEIMKTDEALWISPNDDYLVYVEFNDSNVEQMTYLKYDDARLQYPSTVTQHYPKAGTAIPSVRLKIFDFQSNTTTIVAPPKQLSNKDHYIISVTWRGNSSFAAVWLNRQQNISRVMICEASTGKCHLFSILFTPSLQHYFVNIPRLDGNGERVKQVMMVDANIDLEVSKAGGSTIYLTTSSIEIVSIVGFYNSTVYFIGIPLDDPKERHLYHVTSDKDSTDFHGVKCITCNLSEHCLYVDASFGPTGDFYILECLGPGVPYYSLYATPDVYVTDLEDNSDLRRRVSSKLTPVEKYFNISLPDGNFILGKLLLPSILVTEELIQYNVLIVANDDIGVQSVTHKFNLGWEHFMSIVHSIIVAKIDTSGSSGRGENWSKAVHRNIGHREVDEILASLRYFKSLPYTNEDMGIVGKGYGGHVTLSALSSDFNDVIKCGAAASPIIDYSFMDSYVAEKYNVVDGYHIVSHQENKLIRHISNLQRHKVLLAHGTLNDLIHYQQSAQYVKALVKENIKHNLRVYPDSRDVFEDYFVKRHMLTSIENFFIDCFGIDPSADPKYFVEDAGEE
ncbi:diacylglycerol pyrophosphate phosphatase [Mactra antiquata]